MGWGSIGWGCGTQHKNPPFPANVPPPPLPQHMHARCTPVLNVTLFETALCSPKPPRLTPACVPCTWTRLRSLSVVTLWSQTLSLPNPQIPPPSLVFCAVAIDHGAESAGGCTCEGCGDGPRVCSPASAPCGVPHSPWARQGLWWLQGAPHLDRRRPRCPCACTSPGNRHCWCSCSCSRWCCWRCRWRCQCSCQCCCR